MAYYQRLTLAARRRNPWNPKHYTKPPTKANPAGRPGQAMDRANKCVDHNPEDGPMVPIGPKAGGVGKR